MNLPKGFFDTSFHFKQPPAIYLERHEPHKKSLRPGITPLERELESIEGLGVSLVKPPAEVGRGGVGWLGFPTELSQRWKGFWGGDVFKDKKFWGGYLFFCAGNWFGWEMICDGKSDFVFLCFQVGFLADNLWCFLKCDISLDNH